MYNIKNINIFSGEPLNSWILGKFAKILKKEYEKYNISVNYGYSTNSDIDFNHCIIYLHCNPETATEKDVVMITHIDEYWKYELLEKLVPKIAVGICMSKDQMNKLINMGLDKNKLCFINPAHDGVIPIKKWVVGLASRVYPDGRKNEIYFNKLANVLNPKYFKFKIMGANWEPQVEYMQNKGFEVEYYSDFNYDIYTKKFFADMDYYLYMGLDEGQMGFVDAQSAGVKTIVTSQGYHLDSDSPITHPFSNYEELEQIFLNLQQEKKNIVDAMQDWTWEKYAIKHLQIMEYLKTGKIIENSFKDGLNSLIYNKEHDFQYDVQEKENYLKYLKRDIKINEAIKNAYIPDSKQKVSFGELIFSIKNEYKDNTKYKIFRILGLKFTFKKH